ncbi:MAG: hypothetical protein U9Q03_04545 [Patescibacteria group bacterium]|nr:hypothetical protein [Patescibacteria group bacterium]
MTWKVDYGEYRKTPRWEAFAKTIRQRDGDRCTFCLEQKSLTDVHHWHYDNLRDERPEDASVVCRACHNYLSYMANNRGYDYAAAYARVLRRLQEPEPIAEADPALGVPELTFRNWLAGQFRVR